MIIISICCPPDPGRWAPVYLFVINTAFDHLHQKTVRCMRHPLANDALKQKETGAICRVPRNAATGIIWALLIYLLEL